MKAMWIQHPKLEIADKAHLLVALVLTALLAVLWLAGPARAQEEEESQGVVQPSGLANLTFEGRRASVPFTLGPRGPLFALRPIAAQLGVELLIGPLGDNHTLELDDREIRVGPESASMLVVIEGAEPRVVPLSQSPLKNPDGLQVPLDFLERALGDELGQDFVWDGRELRLDVSPRRKREIQAAITLVNQGRVTTAEIAFSTQPRYRVESGEGAVEIQLVDDSLAQPVRRPLDPDPLVEEISVSSSRLRFQLAPAAAAAEPRWLDSPPRLILEIYRQAANDSEPEADEERTFRSARDDDGLRTIVIDPGHGGAESGALGPSGSQEKELTLILARSLKRQLERRIPVRVVLTRAGDTDLPLDARAALANQHKGDLFISLHLNAAFGPSAHGAETYFLSREASDQRAAEAAALENRSAEDDPEADLQLILWDLAQSYHLAESQRFANLVQEELNLALGLRDRGVKQAPFRVLMGAAMPAVLVELGFLSNPDEEAKLQTLSYRGELVDALVRAILRFRSQLETRARAEEPSR